MKVKTLHPNEVAFDIIKEGIESGYTAEDIVLEVSERMDWPVEAVQVQVKTFLVQKQIFKLTIKDDMVGTILFYSLTKPPKPVVKHIGSMIIAGSFHHGLEIRQATGIKHFSKARKDQPGITFYKKIITPRTLVKIVPKMVRTKWPVRKDTPIVKMVRTKKHSA